MNIDGDEVETLEAIPEVSEMVDDEVAEQTTDETTDAEGEADEPEALVVQFGEEAPEEVEDTDHREALRNMRARIKELEAQVKTAPAQEVPTLGPKPTLESCDYDTDEFEAKIAKWHDDKRAHDARQAEAEETQRKAAEEWQGRLSHYNTRKTELAKRVPDMDEAEAFVLETFDVTQQGILVDMAEDAAVLGYALAKNPSKAKDLAGEKNYVRFTKKLTLLEASLKTTTRKPPPPADRPLNSTASSRGTVDGELERLRAEAERTNDYSKVREYRSKHR